MNAREFYDFSLAKAREKKSDAFLFHIGTTHLAGIDTKGKCVTWDAQFYSPSTKTGYIIQVVDGKLHLHEKPNFKWNHPQPPEVTDRMLDSKKLYAMVVDEVGDNFNPETDMVEMQLGFMGTWQWRLHCHAKGQQTGYKLHKYIDAAGI
jgi:hypothetical protein